MAEWGVYNFEYDMQDDRGNLTPWKAYIAAGGHEEAKIELFRVVGSNIKITTTGKTCRLDAISNELRKVIVESSQPKKRGPGRPSKVEIPADVKG